MRRDALYFDRVHAVAPIIHKMRYSAWSEKQNISKAQAGLRSAMRTVASATSAQYQALGDALRAETRQILEDLEPSDTTQTASTAGKSEAMPIALEQIQSWLLLVHYDLLRESEQQVMQTALRAIRLVQLARLHEIDDSEGEALSSEVSMTSDSYETAEEKRRTFWLAYCFDHLFVIRSEWAMNLHDEMVSLEVIS